MKTQDQIMPDDERFEDEAYEEMAERETSYLPHQASAQADDRWQQIQSDFVDDPRKSVTEAHELVGERCSTSSRTSRKNATSWNASGRQGSSASTEDLRVCLQRYRDFFARLLPSSEAASKH